MAYYPKSTNKIIQDQEIRKLRRQLEQTEKQLAETALLRRKLEELANLKMTRTHKTFEKVNHFGKKEKIVETYEQGQNVYSQIRNKLIEELIAKRTREFYRKQAEKAAKNRYLTKEKQRIQQASMQLRDKNNLLQSLPSPIGNATDRMWGHKYSLYTPMHYDYYNHIYTPAFQDGYYAYIPRAKKKRRWFENTFLYDTTPLYQSLWNN